ncbi:MAG: hypothetical protein QM537_07630, partial [Candidatus Symbiobacter sp.]|nr:hypothetical protein [Candidatus Symbiobacter sp.]
FLSPPSKEGGVNKVSTYSDLPEEGGHQGELSRTPCIKKRTSKRERHYLLHLKKIASSCLII